MEDRDTYSATQKRAMSHYMWSQKSPRKAGYGVRIKAGARSGHGRCNEAVVVLQGCCTEPGEGGWLGPEIGIGGGGGSESEDAAEGDDEAPGRWPAMDQETLLAPGVDAVPLDLEHAGGLPDVEPGLEVYRVGCDGTEDIGAIAAREELAEEWQLNRGGHVKIF